MFTRFAGVIAVLVLILSATSFTAQEPPRAAPPSLDLGPAAAKDSASIRLEFRAGKDKGDHRIIWQRDGVELEAARIAIGQGPVALELVAVADGIIVNTRAFRTICKSIDIRPGELGVDSRSLPSASSSGDLGVLYTAAGRATVTCRGFEFECTKVVLAGQKNRLEIMPGPQALQVKTKDAEIRGANSLKINYEHGFRLSLEAFIADHRGNPAGERVQLAPLN